MKNNLLVAVISTCITFSYAYANTEIKCASGKENKNITQAVKWYRNSAEQNALYEQAFDIAGNYVDYYVNNKRLTPKSWGVIIDIDETTLDNSFYMHNCKQLAESEDDFSRYVSNAKTSKALPGVVRFTHKVHKLGGYVSLVSNRDGSYKDENGSVMANTIENLKQENIYFDQVLLSNQKESKDPNNKNPRFLAVITGKYDNQNMYWSNKVAPHQVIAYLGDNIQDFPNFKQICKSESDFNSRTCMNSKDHDQNIYKKFGHGFFIMPNPMYGSWEPKDDN